MLWERERDPNFPMRERRRINWAVVWLLFALLLGIVAQIGKAYS